MRALLLVLALTACKSDHDLTEAGDPALTLDTPERAAWLDVGEVEADGTWTALSGLTVNGASATASGALSGTWQGQIEVDRGISIVEASGTDGRGDVMFVKNHVIAGEFVSPNAAVSDAATVRINENGIDLLLEAAAARFDEQTVEDTLVAANPVYSGEFLEIAGEDIFAIDLFVNDVTFSGLDLSAEPTTGQLDFTGSLYNLDVGTELTIEILGSDFLDPIVIDVYADRIDLTGGLVIGAHDGDLTVDLVGTEVAIEGFFFDTDLIPSSIEGTLLSQAVEGMIEDRIGGLLEEQVAGLVQEQLSSLDLSFTSEVLDHEVVVEADFADASVDPAGVSITMDIDVDVAGDTEHPYRGYLTAPGRAPTPDASADVSLSIWDDLLNKMLFESWKGGMLNLTLSTEDDSLDPVALLPLHAEEGTISVDAWLPPVVVQSGTALQAQLGEVHVTVDTPGGELGEHLVASVAAYVDVDLVARNGEIQVELGEPTLDITVLESDWGASNVTVANLLEESLPIDLLLSVVGDIAFPLPEFFGVQVTATAGRDGNQTHTSVRVDLEIP
jgi:hypothetical protein